MTEPHVIAGRYELLQKLGSGRDGAVHLAFDRVCGSEVALKWTHLDAGRQAGALGPEFDLATRLAHPSWVRALDRGRDGDLDYFTMELVRGTALDEAGLDAPQLLTALFQACGALDALHGLGYVHADLKPDHLLIVPEGGPRSALRLKLLDLSLAIAREPGDAGSDEGTVRGTMQYASPAVLAGHRPGPGDDLFALGASFRASIDAGSTGGDSGHTGEEDAATLLDEVLARLTSADTDSRYRSARHVLADLTRHWPASVGRVPVEIGHLPLVGREPELAALDRALRDFDSERSPTWIALHGAPGMGKSRVAAEAVRLARRRGQAVLRLNALDAADWARACRELDLVHVGLDVRSNTSGGSGGSGGSGEPGGPGGASPDRGTAPDPGEVASRLRRAAESVPLVVLLTGELESSPATRAAAAELLDAPAELPLCVVTLSVTPRAAAHEGWRTHAVVLEPLGPTAAASLCGPYLGDAHEDLVLTIHDHCQGHPGFTEAAARAVAQELARASEGSELSPEALARVVHARLPRSVEDGLRRGLEVLSPAARRAASALAVFSRPVPRTVLDAYCRATPAVHAEAIDELLRAAVLERVEVGTEPELRFCSESFRRLLQDDAREAEWARHHERASAAWEAAPDGPARSLALAHHALGGDDATRMIALATEAADLLLARDDAAAAAGPLLHCIERLEHAEQSEHPEHVGGDLPALGAVWQRLGEAQFRRGLLELADRSFARAAALFARLGGPGGPGLPGGEADGFAFWARWGETLDGLGESERAREVLSRALAAPSSGRPDTHAHVCEVLGRLEFRLGDPEGARRTFELGLQALADADEGSSLTAASLWNDLGIVAYRAGHLDEALDRHTRALAIRRNLGDEDGIARSLTNLGSVDMTRGRYRSALARYEDSLVLKRRVGNQQTIALTLSNLALLDFWLGDYRSSIERHEEAQRIREEIGAAPDQVRSLTHLSNVWHEKSEFTRAERLARRAIETAERTAERDEGFVRALAALAETRCSVGQPQEALAAIDEGLTASEQLGYGLGLGLLGNLRAVALAQLTPVAAGAPQERPEGASRDAVRELESSIAVLREVGEPRILATALLRGSTVLSDTPGLALREDWVEEAYGIAERLETAPLLARAELLRAHLELTAGKPNEASSRLFRVLDRARSLGMPELLWRAHSGLALFHTQYGRPDRVVLWLHRCIGTFRQVVDRIRDPEMQAAYLEVAARKRVLESISEWTAARVR